MLIVFVNLFICCIKLHRKTEQNGADPAEGPAGRTSLGPVRFSPFLRCSFTLLISKQIKKALINLLNQNYDYTILNWLT